MTEIEQLRQEVADLKRQIASLRAAMFPTPVPYIAPLAVPPYPGAPWPVTCGGAALTSAIAMADTWCWNGGEPLMGGTDWSKTSGPNAP